MILAMVIAAITAMSVAKAEYRAFELTIVNSATGQERTAVSNLDPRQYKKYYPTKNDETVMYTDTWMCRGNTSYFQAICPNPKESNSPTPQL